MGMDGPLSVQAVVQPWRGAVRIIAVDSQIWTSKRSLFTMKVWSMHTRFCGMVTLAALCLATPVVFAQAAPKAPAQGHGEPRLRSKLFVYDLRDGSSHLVYTADEIWEAPNWSPDGKYLISNSRGGIYKLALKQDGTAETPQRLAIPADAQCNNDKAISPNGKMIAYSATVPPEKGSQA